jgi:DNA-binding CsgD family transcriptional regulator
MATQTVSSRHLPLSASSGPEGSTAEDLLRALRDSVGAAHPERLEGSAEEIVLDLDLEDARYLLVRMPLADTRIQLSPREQEIARMVARGHSNKMIADVLSISSWTVCTHLRRIFAKAGVGSRAAMVARLDPRSGNPPGVTRVPVSAAANSNGDLAISAIRSNSGGGRR